MQRQLLLLLLACAVSLGSGSRVLMWMDFGSKSHFVVWRPLVEALAARNHSVTVVAPVNDGALAAMDNVDFIHINCDLSDSMNSSDIFQGKTMMDPRFFLRKIDAAQDLVFANDRVRQLMTSNTTFDVAIFSPMCVGLGLYLAKEYFGNPPLMFYFVNMKFALVDNAMGNPINPSYIALDFIDVSGDMDFLDRAKNAISSVFYAVIFEYFYINNMNSKVASLMNLPEQPDLQSIISSADFALFNAMPAFDGVRPVNPNTALVGGVHLRPADVDKLPRDVRDWLDGADEHGVIFVSYGSVLTASDLPEDKRQILIKVFSRLKQRVLWKWETEHMPGKPDNVLLKKWLPQQDILGHPNVRLFVSHGGLMSTQETLYHGVPALIMPGFGDQFANAARAQKKGYGAQLRWTDLTEERLYSSILSLLENSTVEAATQELGTVLRDEMTHPLDRAVFHVEYVIRHKGAKHLRSPARHLNFFQYMLLDVVAVLAAAAVLAAFVAYKVVAFAVRRFASASRGATAPAAAKKLKTN